jgi:hypothetical protein
MKHIVSRILRSENVCWRDFEFLQPEGFKDLTAAGYSRLRESILRNGFVESFKVWQPAKSKKLYCLDGYHRCKVLRALASEGVEVPETFPADFLDCRTRKEAAKLVLVYSSIYASITDEGLYAFQDLHGLDLESIAAEIDLPDLDIEKFIEGWGGEKEDGSNASNNNDIDAAAGMVECPNCGHVFRA